MPDIELQLQKKKWFENGRIGSHVYRYSSEVHPNQLLKLRRRKRQLKKHNKARTRGNK